MCVRLVLTIQHGRNIGARRHVVIIVDRSRIFLRPLCLGGEESVER